MLPMMYLLNPVATNTSGAVVANREQLLSPGGRFFGVVQGSQILFFNQRRIICLQPGGKGQSK
jgi:hypothetical protein